MHASCLWKLIPDLICDVKDFVPYGKKAAFRWLGCEEMECQDVKDILNCEQDELSIYELQGEQKEEKKQMMMKTRKLLRDS
ncbi:hypothetical protein M513_01046 [Trichuris suis]|uniref:Uncharacterized protein n=1 Tax=Trichuris suis TaxID=68888 RepID=A0A085MM37_9BILA|nr:hypothetical protein M513_01046 [Trichuris suis]